jgi:hypothetical protein
MVRSTEGSHIEIKLGGIFLSMNSSFHLIIVEVYGIFRIVMEIALCG